MAEAGIPRVASNVVSPRTGATRTPTRSTRPAPGSPSCCPRRSSSRTSPTIGLIRVDLAAASALVGLLEDLYADEGATFPYDVPVPAGTTDFTQFILGAQDAGVGGVTLALGEQEAIQVVRAGQQLGTDLRIGASLGTFPHSTVADLGDFADQMVFLWSFAPATFDLPVYEALRARTSRRPARSRSSPGTSRPARCVRGSACTPCSG